MNYVHEGLTYLQSVKNRGFRNRNRYKPRCVVSRIFCNYIHYKDFIPSYKGIEKENTDWSLVKFFREMARNKLHRDAKFNNEIISIRSKQYLIKGIHKKIGDSSYVWSDIDIIKEI